MRGLTESLCAPLETEDYGLQCMPDASPPKWHLAHTTWFFETFLLAPRLPGHRPFDARFHGLFNSYYQALGTPFPRAHRGHLSRPTVREVYAYRRQVDDTVLGLLEAPGGDEPSLLAILEWGLQHEQQHQELLLMDIQYNLGFNPLRPAYLAEPGRNERAEKQAVGHAVPLRWVAFAGGNRRIGSDERAFAFDNERPRHVVHLAPYALADRLVTCGEYLEFMEDGGYRRPELWLSDGWDFARKASWEAPLYWEKAKEGTGGIPWWRYSLAGMHPVDLGEPVCHVSFYEADAYARWAGKRLPTEAEWEHAATSRTGQGGEEYAEEQWRSALEASNFLESGLFRPVRPRADGDTGSGLRQMFGDAWEWTQSAYEPYPGYRPPTGALGEYNGKFMNNQRVLRGGSCATPRAHVRPTYRNFFRPEDRWAFTGIRLCEVRSEK